MPYKVRDSYLENRILGASPLELVAILYQEALKSVKEAIRHLAAGDIRGRSREVTRAQLILGELSNSLDLQSGGGLASNLSDLYDYMQRRLVDGNSRQEVAPFEEVARLLAILEDGWRQCASSESAAPLEEARTEETVHAF